MTVTDGHTARIRRKARIARIIGRLERLDDATLEELDRLTRQALSGSFPSGRRASRRQFLKAAGAGAAVVVATGGVAAWQLGYGHLAALQQEADTLREIVALYEEMEQTGLDDRLGGALQALGILIGGLRSAAESLRSGLETGRAALLDFQSRFPSLQAAFRWLRQSLSSLSQRMLALENSVSDLLEIAGPITETVGGFLRWILDHLPGSSANLVQEGLERMGEVVSLLPDLVEGLHQQILEPMDGWFSSQSAKGLNATLITPLISSVLDPAEALLDQIIRLTETWEKEWVGPLQQALEQRQAIRERIQGLRP